MCVFSTLKLSEFYDDLRHCRVGGGWREGSRQRNFVRDKEKDMVGWGDGGKGFRQRNFDQTKKHKEGDKSI